ncbi:MAG: DUF721 domain-containing protein [Bacteriovoracaceae bacterium]
MSQKKKPSFKKLNQLLESGPFQKIASKKNNFTAQKSNKAFYSSGFDFLELIQDWEKIVGGNLSKTTIPLKLKSKNLVILTENPHYNDQLKFLEQALIKKIEEKFPTLQGQVEKLSFYYNPGFFNEKAKTLAAGPSQSLTPQKKTPPKKLHKHSPEYKKKKDQFDNKFQEFEDSDVKELLQSIFFQIDTDKDV